MEAFRDGAVDLIMGLWKEEECATCSGREQQPCSPEASEKTQRRVLGQGPRTANRERVARGGGRHGEEEEEKGEEASPLHSLTLRCSWILALAGPVPLAIPRRTLHVCFGKWGWPLIQNRALEGLIAGPPPRA